MGFRNGLPGADSIFFNTVTTHQFSRVSFSSKFARSFLAAV